METPDRDTKPSDKVRKKPYRPPLLTRLGTLEDLTRSTISIGTDDGLSPGAVSPS